MRIAILCFEQDYVFKLLLVLQGAMKVGGMSEVWYQNGQWNRLNFVK